MRTGLNCIACGVTFFFLSPFAGAEDGGPPRTNLLERSQAARIVVVQGRLQMDPSHYSKIRREEISAALGLIEFLCISASQGLPSLHYSARTPDQRLTVDISEGAQVTIEQAVWSPESHSQISFFQPPAGDVHLKVVTNKNSVADLRAASLWHLYAASPKVCEQWLSPILGGIVPNFDPTDFVSGINAAVQNRMAHPSLLTRENVQRLVSQLASPDKEDRTSAQQGLVSLGVGAIPLLDEIPAENLDGEQKRRLQGVRRRLQRLQADDPQSVSAWLVSDFGYCQAIASSMPWRDRVALDQHLRHTCGRSLPKSILGEGDQSIIQVATRPADVK
jgi:hypothetical protein